MLIAAIILSIAFTVAVIWFGWNVAQGRAHMQRNWRGEEE